MCCGIMGILKEKQCDCGQWSKTYSQQLIGMQAARSVYVCIPRGGNIMTFMVLLIKFRLTIEALASDPS